MNQEFAGYSITRSMSGGGMTKLYVAIDAQQTRYVIRVLDAVAGRDRKSRNRFFHGGEVIARLHTPKPHPNIVRFIKAGYEGKTPYMVLEYVESRTLRDLILYREPLLTGNIIIFIRQLANVIQYVHAHGFLHLDAGTRFDRIHKQARNGAEDVGIGMKAHAKTLLEKRPGNGRGRFCTAPMRASPLLQCRHGQNL